LTKLIIQIDERKKYLFDVICTMKKTSMSDRIVNYINQFILDNVDWIDNILTDEEKKIFYN